MKPVAFIVKAEKFNIPGLERGDYNGYVAVPEDHKYFGYDCYKISEIVEVHGGITLSEPVICGTKTSEGFDISPQYVGKINLLIAKGEFLDSIDNKKESKRIIKEFWESLKDGDDWWIFGFDTAHYGDDSLIWDREAVVAETLNLLKQMEE